MAEQQITFQSSETLFSVVAALNTCGYDADLAGSNPIREQVREEIAANLGRSIKGEDIKRELCTFIREHQQPDSSHELAQYVSLALFLGPPPVFELKTQEAEMPPDASYVVGFVSSLQTFYQAADLHSLWLKHQPDYEALLARHREVVKVENQKVDGYLRLPLGSYTARSLTILMEPMASPAATNARTYGTDYFLVLSPDSSGSIPVNKSRHMYLHYLLDPMLLSRPIAMQRLQAILPAVVDAPMDDNYKRDIALLVTESLIRAVEARLLPGGKAAEDARNTMIERSVAEGFVLTRPFYSELIKFEKEPAGFRNALADILADIDVAQEKKRAEQVIFSKSATPDVLAATPRRQPDLLDQAEAKLRANDRQGAHQLAQQALEKKQGDQSRALFILGESAPTWLVARQYFERALEVGNNPRVVAWSHVYLGHIHDGLDEREEALKHYRAALSSGYQDARLKAAAEAGLKQPYEPPQSASKPEKPD